MIGNSNDNSNYILTVLVNRVIDTNPAVYTTYVTSGIHQY